MDFNFKGPFADKNLREAFAKCVPRQQIIDNLIKPQNANAQIMESRFIFPFQPQYKDFVSTIGGSAYDKQDIPGAKALLQKAGKVGMTVRVGWRKDPAQLNKRRADTVALLQNACNQAGFKIVDSGTPTFFSKEWPGGQWDVAMFAWAGSPLVTGSDGIYTTGGGQNPGKYSNTKVDALTTQLDQEINKDKQLGIQKQIDTLLWGDVATIPLFAFPGIFAATKNAEGLEYNATQADLSWNADKWSLK
jgi:peptide/nickel transport system substrate-binding protein